MASHSLVHWMNSRAERDGRALPVGCRAITFFNGASISDSLALKFARGRATPTSDTFLVTVRRRLACVTALIPRHFVLFPWKSCKTKATDNIWRSSRKNSEGQRTSKHQRPGRSLGKIKLPSGRKFHYCHPANR